MGVKSIIINAIFLINIFLWFIQKVLYQPIMIFGFWINLELKVLLGAFRTLCTCIRLLLLIDHLVLI
jgi:hypothetical protein